MRYLLDTNIVSEVTKPRPSSLLLHWLGQQEDDSLFISTLTLGEIHKGILEMPVGRRQKELHEWFNSKQGPPALFSGRILSLDEPAALCWARLMAEGRLQGRPRSPLDMMIAAIAIHHNCQIVTANEKDFAGLSILNPLRTDRPTASDNRGTSG